MPRILLPAFQLTRASRHGEFPRWRIWLFWIRRNVGAKIKVRSDSWFAGSTPQARVDGILLIDFSRKRESIESFAVINDALRLIEYYDQSRYRALKRYIKQITIDDGISTRAAFFLGTTGCMLRPDLLRAGSATVAAALVHEATHARLDRLRVRQSAERRARIEMLCMGEEVAFACHFPETPELREWMQRMRNHIDESHHPARPGKPNAQPL